MYFLKPAIFLMIFLTATIANAQQTGMYLKSATLKEILGNEATKYQQYIGVDEFLTWDIYVPEDYDDSKPAGVMVYAGSPNFIRPPIGWLSVIKDKNLIWVSSRRSGNASSIYQKTLLAMASVPLIEKEYNIDSSRIYITGEGQTASRAALKYPEKFKGAIFIGNRLWEDNAEEKIKKALNNAFVFVTREVNVFPRGNRFGHRKFKTAGVKKLKLYFVRGSLRYDRLRFAESIEFLDG